MVNRANKTAALANAPPDLAQGWAVLSGEIADDEIDAPAVQVDIAQRRAANWRGSFWRGHSSRCSKMDVAYASSRVIACSRSQR